MASNENLIPIPGRLHSVATEGHVAGADEIFDDTLNKDQATINQEVNEAIGTGGSVDSRIAAAINALDSSKSQSAGADGLALSVVEENGKITSISGSIASNTYDSYGSASAAQSAAISAAATDATTKVNAAKSEIIGNATSDCDTLGEAEAKINANTTAISNEAAARATADEQLRILYENLTQSDIIVGPRPSSGQLTNVIYREPDQSHTPPQNYSDYVWYNNGWVLMATYDNAIDDVPTVGSNNLVKSGGVENDIYDVAVILRNQLDDTFQEESVIATTWAVGNISDTTGQEVPSTYFIRTNMLSKGKYDRIYYKGRYHASCYYFYYNEDGSYVGYKIFPWSETTTGGFGIIDTLDKYTKFRLSYYVGSASITSQEHDVSIFTLNPQRLTYYSDYLKSSPLYSLSNWLYKPVKYSGNWTASGTDWYYSDMIEKPRFAEISAKTMIYSMSGNILFYNKETDSDPAYTYPISGSDRFFDIKNLGLPYEYFKVGLYFANITTTYTPEIFAECVLIETYTNAEGNQFRALGRTDNLVAPVSSFSSDLNISKSNIKEKDIIYPISSSDVAKNIVIASQSDYNTLTDATVESIFNINSGSLNIIFEHGEYNIGKALDFSSVNKPNVSVNIIGNNSLLKCYSSTYERANAVKTMGSHYILPYSNDYSFETVFVDKDGNKVPVEDSGVIVSEGCDYATTQVVEVANSGIETNNKVFKFGVPEKFSEYIGKSASYFEDSYLYISASFVRIVCVIHKFERDVEDNKIYVYVSCLADPGYLYTTISNLEDSINNWYNNARHYLAGKEIYAPFYIVNAPEHLVTDSIMIYNGYIYIPNSVDKVYECSAHTKFINIENSTFKEFSMSGFTFGGHAAGNPADSGGFINLKNISNVNICNNNFKNINTTCILSNCDFTGGAYKENTSYSATNVNIINNSFFNCICSGISALADKLTISYNKLDRCGSISYTIPIVGRGRDIAISDNEIKNFSWSGLATNSGKGWWEKGWCNGVVERNHIYNDDEWNSQLDRNCLNDKGAIYNYIYHDGLHVRNNIIHDIVGRWQTRGLYGDNGCTGIIIYNNLIYNITNDAIYYWPVPWVNGPHLSGYPICMDNVCMYNIVLGSIYISNTGVAGAGTPVRDYNYSYCAVNYIGKQLGDYLNVTNLEYIKEAPITDNESYIAKGILYTKVDFKNWGFDNFITSKIRYIHD